jgi:hypothetical protein
VDDAGAFEQAIEVAKPVTASVNQVRLFTNAAFRRGIDGDPCCASAELHQQHVVPSNVADG